ncbi:MAG: MFS transporter [Nannocystaceae bacterium]
MNARTASAPQPRGFANVLVLATGQALHVSGQSMVVTISGLVGVVLAPKAALATLPITAVLFGSLLTAIPASLLMARIGRRAGFMLGATSVVIGSAIATWAISISSFWFFVAGSLVMGFNGGFAPYYRFAAVDQAEAAFKPKAISLVLSGGVVAAFVGPNLGHWTAESYGNARFMGSFAVASCVGGLLVICLSFLRLPRVQRAEHKDAGRPLGKIVRQPEFYVSMIVATVAYATMSLIMTATPLAMAHHGMGVNDTATVISWHVFAMFAPAFFTGSIVARFGPLNVMLAGMAMLALCCAIALCGVDFHHFFAALILLGLGWCLCFVAASTLLTECYAPGERAKVQAANDFVIMTSVAVASALAGGLLHFVGWPAVQLTAIPFVLASTLVVLVLILSKRHESPGRGRRT